MKKLFLLVILLFTGCYNYHELNELAIVNSIGIDKQDNNYILTIQVINTEMKDQSNSEHPKFLTYKGSGKNIQEALIDVSNKVSKNIYLNSVEILIIEDKLASYGIHDILDFFFRKTEINKQFYTIISKDYKAYDILNTIAPTQNINSQKIKEILRIDSEYFGISKIVTFEQLLNDYLNKTKEIVLPTIYIEDNIVKLGPLSLFKNDKLYSYLSIDDSISYNILNNNIKNTYITIECSNNKYLTLKLNDLKVKNIFKNNELFIDLKANGSIEETNCIYNLENKNDLDKISKLTQNDLNNKIYNLLNKTKKHNINILNNSYKNININSNIQIISKGNILKVIENG